MTKPRKTARAARTLPSTGNADVDLARLRALQTRQGTLTPDVVLSDAQDASSPLHRHFNWDDTEAAHLFRLQQARELIVRFRVLVTTTERTISALVYMRDPRAKSNEQGMVAIEHVISDQDLAREVVVQEVTRALDLLRRADRQAQALGLGNVVETLVEDALRLRDRLSAVGVPG
jgi:hypothetical protein